MDAKDLYHFGLVADDYEGTQAQLTALLGYRWGDEIHLTMPFAFASGETRELTVEFCYSTGDEPRLELIRPMAGTPWQPASAGWHHFGYWSDDVRADTESLLADGWTLELAANAPDEGYGRFTYVRSPSGYLVEPVSIGAKPRFERWWAGGSLTDPVPAA